MSNHHMQAPASNGYGSQRNSSHLYHQHQDQNHHQLQNHNHNHNQNLGVYSSGPNDLASAPQGVGEFEIFDWHPAYQSCQKYFLDHAQYDNSVQAVAALINICLPFQWAPTPAPSSTYKSGPGQGASTYNPARPILSSSSYNAQTHLQEIVWVSLIPYIRRLIVTGFDREAVLHGFFGDDWRKGVGPVQECERRNYLFAAKSGGWAKVKAQYDMGPQETVPFLKPPQNVQLAEIESAEKLWSQWLATEDWMVGPRAPEGHDDLPYGMGLRSYPNPDHSQGS